MREIDRNAKIETDRTEAEIKKKTGIEQTKRQKQQSPVLPVKPEPACMAAETKGRLLHSDSCALIPLYTTGTCQHSHVNLALLETNNLC